MATTEFLSFLNKKFQKDIKKDVDLIIDRGHMMLRKGELLHAFILLFSAASWLCDESSFRKRLLEQTLVECNNQLAKVRGDYPFSTDLSKYLQEWSILAYTQHLMKTADKYYQK